ncbi:MAG: protein-arginine deiminase, partial [Deltaproteobacteria bacterium]|nr:protein-arginine deiminase [Deltaproteobacteria bacterium]
EMIAWVKTSSGKGYRMLIASTEVTLDLLKGIKNAGDGSALMFAGKEDEISVSAFLASPLAGPNEEVQNRVDNTREQLKNELGLSEDDIVDIPCLFKKEGTYDKYAIALMPNMINSLIIGQHVIAPDPYGPIIGGKDRFKEALKERLEPLGQTVHFIDDWYPYHTWLGEIHCATNSKRLPDDAAWWK